MDDQGSTAIGRLIRVGRRIGALEQARQMRWGSVPSVLDVIVRHGLDLRTIHEVWARLRPRALAVVDERRSVTFEELNEEINRLADGLRRQYRVGPGRAIMVAMKNRAEYLATWMAAARLGAPMIHASWRQSRQELTYQVDHGRPAVIVAGESVAGALDDRWSDKVVGVDEAVDGEAYMEVVARGRNELATVPEEGASENVVYTSGTTGRPKGAVRDMAAYGVMELAQILERLPLQMGERHLVVSPIYHSGGQIFSLMETALGSTLYLSEEFDAAATLKRLHHDGIHSLFLVPTMLREILELDEAQHRRFEAPSVRGILCGAAPFPEALRQRAMERFGTATIHDFYGATEIGWITAINGEEMRARPGSVGRPLAGQEVRIVDDQGQALAAGEVGTIYVRNSHLMAGYLDNEQATEEIVREGWMTVEDLGYVDEEGYLYLAGRARDMVISGGVNIYPAEIENTLMGHPGIREVAVIGVDDERWGEALVAVVVRRPNSEVTKQELVAYAKERLSDYKVPRRWQWREELPRNPTGKVLKRQLQSQLAT